MKNWYDRKYTKKDLKELKKFVKTFGFKIHIKSVFGGGQADYINGILEIDNGPKSLKELISVTLHEMWHCICYEEGLYSTYHCKRMPRTKEEIAKFRKVAYRAEQFVDKKAEETMRQCFPDIPYSASYRDEIDREWYHKYYLDKYYSLP